MASEVVLNAAPSGACCWRQRTSLFLEDKNKNGKTDLGLVDTANFLSFTDVYIDARTLNLVELTFTAGSEDTTIVDENAVFSNSPSTDQIINLTFQ